MNTNSLITTPGNSVHRVTESGNANKGLNLILAVEVCVLILDLKYFENSAQDLLERYGDFSLALKSLMINSGSSYC